MGKDNIHGINFKLAGFIPYWLFSLIWILVTTWSFCEYTQATVESVLIFIGSQAIVVASVITAVYAMRNHRATNNQVDLDKKQKAFDIACRWSELKENRQGVHRARKELKGTSETDGISEKGMIAKIKSEEYRIDFFMVFGFFEQVAGSIANDLADEEVYYAQIRSAVVNHFEVWNFWIIELQKDQPYVYCQAEALAAKWNSRMTQERQST